MFVVTFKTGVKWDPVTSAGVRILAALDRAASLCSVNLEVTCGSEPMAAHGPTDPHSRGVAFDVAVVGMSPMVVVSVKKTIESYLGPDFTVLYEVNAVPSDPVLQSVAYVNAAATGPHYHIQPRRGTVWPPVVVGSLA
jgi:hypothetical protein